MEFEIGVCSGCGSESVTFIDGVYACESCGRIDDSSAPVFESEPLGFSVCEEAEGANDKRQNSENCLAELLEIHRIALHLPDRVRIEAEATFNEVKALDNNFTGRFSGKLLSGILLFISSRKLDFPITTQEVSPVIGIKHKYFARNLRYFAFLGNLEICKLNLHKFVDRFVAQIVDRLGELDQTTISTNQMKDVIKELHCIIDVVQLASLLPSIGQHPLILSATFYAVCIKISGFELKEDLKNVVCKAHGIQASQLNHAELKFRHKLLMQCTKIPGMPLNISVRNVLEFFPIFKDYHLKIKAFTEGLQSTCDEADSRYNSVNSSKQSPESNEGIVTSARKIITKHLQSRIQTQAEESAETGELSRKSKRRKGFEAFIHDVNLRRRTNDLEELPTFYGTSEITKHGQIIGYTRSLPLKPQHGNLTEIRRGSLHSGINKTTPLFITQSPRLKSPKQNRVRQEQDSVDHGFAEEELNVDEYILQPSEVLLRKLLWTE
eukprot:g6037.t1